MHDEPLFGGKIAHSARTSLQAYVARRRAKGEKVEIVEDAYSCYPSRATITVNGKTRRLYRYGDENATSPRGWKYA